MDNVVKTCRTCGVEKPIELFVKDNRKPLGVRDTCKECRNKYLEKWRKDNPDTIKVNSQRYRQKSESQLKARERQRLYRKTEKGRSIKVNSVRRFRRNSPEKNKLKVNQLDQRRREGCCDPYIKALLRQRGFNGEQLHNQDLLEVQRLIVKTKRL